jgi:hypothetical protein
MQLLALTIALMGLGVSPDNSGELPPPAGIYKSADLTLEITSRPGRGKYSVSGLAERPIDLSRKDSLLVGSMGLFNPLRIELSNDFAKATVRTKEGTRTFDRKPELSGSNPHLYQSARMLIRGGKWADARELLRTVQERNPSFSSEMVGQYIRKCDEEIPNEKHLDRAQDYLDDKRLQVAQNELAVVSPSTLQSDRLQALQARLLELQKAEPKPPDVPMLSAEAAEVRARTLDQTATRLMVASRYGEAHAELRALQAVAPKHGNGSLPERIALCVRETPNEEHLNKATMFLSKGDLSNATAELRAVSTDTVQRVRRARLEIELDGLRRSRAQ